MDRQKILFIVTKSVWGGAQTYIYNLATNLPTDRFDIAVVAGGTGPLFEKLETAEIRTIHIPELERDVRIGKELRSFHALLGIFRNERPDVIHLNSSKIGGLGALAGRIASWRTGKKTRIIFTVHGWAFLEDRPLLWRAATFLASWISALFQDKIILINSHDDTIARKFIPERKRARIYSGLVQHPVREPGEARRFLSQKTGRKIPDDTVLIGTIAELTKNKGLDYLLEAIHRINLSAIRYPLSALIIGEGEDRQKLEQQIRDARLEDTVFLLGFIPDAAQYIPGMDIFVLSSRKEGLPYVVMEAMAAGVPVIASDVGGVPDLVSHNETGILVPPKDAGALAEAIESLARDRKRRASLSQNASEAIRTKYSLRVMLEKTQQLYETTD